jgi:hypothetical protein
MSTSHAETCGDGHDDERTDFVGLNGATLVGEFRRRLEINTGAKYW